MFAVGSRATALAAAVLLLAGAARSDDRSPAEINLPPRPVHDELRITPLLPANTDATVGRLVLEQVRTGNGDVVPLESIARPASWSLETTGDRVVLSTTAPKPEPLRITLRGGWAKLLFAREEGGASALVELGEQARIVDTALSGPAMTALEVEIGTGTPYRVWRDPADTEATRSLGDEPAVLREGDDRPHRLKFDEIYALDPHPFLPARTISFPATIDMPHVRLLERAHLSFGLHDLQPAAPRTIEVTVRSFPESGLPPTMARSRVELSRASQGLAAVEIPMGVVRDGDGRVLIDFKLSTAETPAPSPPAGSPSPQGPKVQVVDPRMTGAQTVRSQRLNAILITLDTTRADHLSLYGYDRSTTPFLDSIAGDLLVFDNAYSQITNTRPSHFSIFTSQYAKDLGIWNNDGPNLPERELTLPEILRSAGWSTAATVSAPFIGPKSGLGQGFDRFEVPIRDIYSQIGEETTWRAEALVSDLADRPFFLWVHYFDAHLPYQPVPSYRGLFWPGPPPTEVDIERSLLFDGAEKDFFVAPNRAYMTAMYDGAIRYLDDQLRQLFDHLARLGLLDRTVVIVAADHGESLGEHGLYFVHDGLYETTTHVPLAIRLPSALHHTGRVSSIAENLGIAPTVLDALGLLSPASFHGTSLLRLPMSGSGVAFFEHYNQLAVGFRAGARKFIDARRLKEDPKLAHGNLREWYDAPALSLFDVEKDPGELDNLAQRDPAGVADAEHRLEAWAARSDAQGEESKVPHPTATIDPQLEKSLRSLGYLR